MGKKVVLIYGEKTVVLPTKVPASKKDEIRIRFKEVMEEYLNPIVFESDSVCVKKEVVLKEPKQIKSIFIPFTSKAIKVLGYACLKDEDANLFYWKDSSITALVFDSEQHLKDYLIKNVM